MSKRDLIATKNFSYATRRLRAGDLIEGVSHNDARVLIGIGKAREAREARELPAPPAEVVEVAKVMTPAAQPTVTPRPEPKKTSAPRKTPAAKKPSGGRSARKAPAKRR